jgi:AraC-like DNA-binding protein
MRYKIVKPCQQLAPYIKHYWMLEIDASEGDITERVIPTGTVELMFHYKNPFFCNAGNTITQQCRSSINGISHAFSDVTALGGSGVITVSFLPYGACQFYKFPLSEIDNSSLSLSELENKEIMELEDRLMNADDLDERIRLIEHYLLKKLEIIRNSDLFMIKDGLSLIRQKRGMLRVDELSSALFTTKRTLERRFNLYLGKSPKQYIRLIRFQEVLKGLYSFNNKNLTEFTYENGYYDQSHFINDMKQLTGYTPRELLEKCPSPEFLFE